MDAYAAPTDRDVDAALDNLRRFTVVGFLDDLDRFADTMAERFGKRPAIRHVNRSPAPAQDAHHALDYPTRQKITDLCAADVEIYRRVRQEIGFGDEHGTKDRKRR